MFLPPKLEYKFDVNFPPFSNPFSILPFFFQFSSQLLISVSWIMNMFPPNYLPSTLRICVIAVRCDESLKLNVAWKYIPAVWCIFLLACKMLTTVIK